VTASTIHTLASSIPDDLLPTLKLGGKTSNLEEDGFDAGVQRFLLRYRSLDFGWHYSLTAARNPDRVHVMNSCMAADDSVVFRAYLHNRFGYDYQDISAAKALLTPAMHATRVMLEGLLVSSNMTLTKCATMTGLPLEAVRAFEKLFFNVLDRRKDIAYMQHVVYPHGRLVEMVEGYLFNTPLGDIIRRSGYSNGTEDVMFLLGTAPDAVNALEQASDTRRLEALIMSMGAVIARNGGLHQPGLPGISHARQLITAGKLGGTQTDEHPMSSDMQGTLMQEVKSYRKPASMIDV
jgi:hypothetical protein